MLVYLLLGWPALQIQSYSLPQHLFSQINWPLMQQAEQAWTQWWKQSDLPATITALAMARAQWLCPAEVLLAAPVTRTPVLENDPETQICPLLLLLLEASQKKKKKIISLQIFCIQTKTSISRQWLGVWGSGYVVCCLSASCSSGSMEGWEWIWDLIWAWWFMSIVPEHLFLLLHPY